MTRKAFLESTLLLGTRSGRALLGSGAAMAAQAQEAGTGSLELKNSNHTLEFKKDTGQLIRFEADGQQFVSADPGDPAFVIQYLDHMDEFQQVDSTTAKTVAVHLDKPATGEEQVLTAKFGGIGGLNLSATVTVRQNATDPLSRWSIAISNQRRDTHYRCAVPVCRDSI